MDQRKDIFHRTVLALAILYHWGLTIHCFHSFKRHLLSVYNLSVTVLGTTVSRQTCCLLRKCGNHIELKNRETKLIWEMIWRQVNDCSNDEDKQVYWRRKQFNLAITVKVIVGSICLNVVVGRFDQIYSKVYKFPEELYSVSIYFIQCLYFKCFKILLKLKQILF